MDPDTQVARLEALSKGTRDAAAQGAKVVVWPELGVGFDPQVEHTDELRALAAETGAYILIGYGVDAEVGWRNEAVMLTPEGEFLDAYGKNYPAGEPHIVTSGRYLVYDTPLGQLAPIICNDVNYTAAVRLPARMGAQLVMVPTRMFAGVWKEMQVMAVFRAVENRVSTVIVDGAFRTTMVDPYGRFVADQMTPEGGPLTLVADVPLGTPNDPTRGWATGSGGWAGGVDRVDDLPVGRPTAQQESRSGSGGLKLDLEARACARHQCKLGKLPGTSCGGRRGAILRRRMALSAKNTAPTMFAGRCWDLIEQDPAAIRRDRTGPGSSPCPTPRRSRERISRRSPRKRTLLPGPGAGSSSRRSGRPAWRST
jgi:predicted amidohydrolase